MKETKYGLNTNVKIFAFVSVFYFVLIVSELIYLKNTTQISQKDTKIKSNIKAVISLPDLAVSSNDTSLRHRSYSNISDLLPNDGELQTNSKMSFVY